MPESHILILTSAKPMYVPAQVILIMLFAMSVLFIS